MEILVRDIGYFGNFQSLFAEHLRMAASYMID